MPEIVKIWNWNDMPSAGGKSMDVFEWLFRLSGNCVNFTS